MNFVLSGAEAALIIPTRNRRERLLRTLDSIRLTPGPDVEAVVVDNGGEDGAAQAVRSLHPSVKIVELNRNAGTSARNIGAEEAKAPVVVMLDDDSQPRPGTVERLVAAFSDPALGIAACMVELPSGEWEEGGAMFVHIGCGAAMRRADFLRLGGYPPLYETYVEEYDLAYRFMAEGLAVRFDETWRVLHEPEARSDFNYMVEKLLANNIYLAWKFFPDEEAEAACRWAVYRYGILAREKNADAGLGRAISLAEARKIEGRCDRRILPGAVLDRVIARRYAAGRFAAWSQEGPVAFLRAGKEIFDLVSAAHEAELSVSAVFDSGLLGHVREIAGVPMRPLPEAADFRGLLCVGGLSPGFNLNTRKQFFALGSERIHSL